MSFLSSCAERGTLQGGVLAHVNHDWNLMGDPITVPLQDARLLKQRPCLAAAILIDR